MSRDLQAGDEFKVVAERSVAPTGAVRIGKVIARDVQAVGQHDQRRALRERVGERRVLRSERQVDARRVSARAARVPSHLQRLRRARASDPRRHGGCTRAPTTRRDRGTPVRAIGDGVVVRAGWGSGYGNVLEIRHRNGFVTRYGHLSRFSVGVHVGSHVTIGQTVAYVGSTGLATGPHLHFEVLVERRAARPARRAQADAAAIRFPTTERAAFDAAARPPARVARRAGHGRREAGAALAVHSARCHAALPR